MSEAHRDARKMGSYLTCGLIGNTRLVFAYHLTKLILSPLFQSCSAGAPISDEELARQAALVAANALQPTAQSVAWTL